MALDVSELQTFEHDVLVIGAGGAGLRAAIECSARGHEHRRHLQEPPRQGPHGHGRGRDGRVDGQRRQPRQLEGPLPRHDARRQVPQRLAHGRAAREAGARARARARGLGRGLRPHQRRSDQPAQLRRSPLPAPGPRRRPHRPRADPHAPGPRRPQGHRLPHGVHLRRPAQGRRTHRRRRGLLARDGPLRALPRQGRDHGHGRRRPLPGTSPATPGSTPATAFASPTTPAPS